MALLNALTDDNATAALLLFLKQTGARVTQATVREALAAHPDFPSLLSMSDVLTEWQIDNTALQLNTVEQLRELPLPLIAHLHKQGGWYVLVTNLQGDSLSYTDPTDGRIVEPVAEFEQKWSGVVLVAEADESAGEVDYATKRQQEVLDDLRGPFVLAGTLLVLLAAMLNVAHVLAAGDWFLLATKTAGLVLSGLLVTKQLGSKNALADRLCRMGTKTNCDSVLNSPAAKLWGWLNWADIGLLYFAGGLCAVLAINMAPSVRSLLYGLALLALPYTVFSVYYQARVLRQWCPLCLGVQAVLLAEGTMAILHAGILPVEVKPYCILGVAFLVPTLAWVLLKPLLVNRPRSRREHDELLRLKRNPDLFRALLTQQPPMPPVSNDLHPILLGNPDAGHTITMVTNPYCGPCARTHKELEALLNRNDDVNAMIMFTCDGAEGPATQVAIQVMALARHGKAALALRDWYESAEKNVDTWIKKYPVNADGTDWLSVAERHTNWCRLANIQITPTLFVNGYQLPEVYRLGDLRWLVNGLDQLTTKPELRV